MWLWEKRKKREREHHNTTNVNIKSIGGNLSPSSACYTIISLQNIWLTFDWMLYLVKHNHQKGKVVRIPMVLVLLPLDIKCFFEDSGEVNHPYTLSLICCDYIRPTHKNKRYRITFYCKVVYS